MLPSVAIADARYSYPPQLLSLQQHTPIETALHQGRTPAAPALCHAIAAPTTLPTQDSARCVGARTWIKLRRQYAPTNSTQHSLAFGTWCRLVFEVCSNFWACVGGTTQRRVHCAESSARAIALPRRDPLAPSAPCLADRSELTITWWRGLPPLVRKVCALGSHRVCVCIVLRHFKGIDC